jgi:hypothetical protein
MMMLRRHQMTTKEQLGDILGDLEELQLKIYEAFPLNPGAVEDEIDPIWPYFRKLHKIIEGRYFAAPDDQSDAELAPDTDALN